MADKIKELEKQIAEKNNILKSLSHEENSNRDKIRRIKAELDKLLYMYIKSLKCSCSNSPFICWPRTQ